VSMDPNQGYPQQPYTPYSPSGYPEQPPSYGQQPSYGQPPSYAQQPVYGQPPAPPSPPAGYPGYPNAYGMQAPMAQETSGMAIASLICAFLIAPVGVILGHIALNQIKDSNGQLGGRGLAIAGLIVGYASIALGLIFVAFFILLVALAANAPNPSPTNFLGLLGI
jgi:Domain of unknown function (DUF4190)